MSRLLSATRCSTGLCGEVMDKYIVKGGKKLRLGYTTGSCAAAAAKAATWMLLTGRRKEEISLTTPKGLELNLAVLEISIEENAVSCAVKKDSGDDPDITDGSLIFARVSRTDSNEIIIDGGNGVGRVTKPGLDQPVGAAAINTVPRQMIYENVTEVCRLTDYRGGLFVEISVPNGEEMAKKTFNPRLGIVGGISILGTTGIVEPMSNQALIDTIKVELQVKRAGGAEYVLFTPGNYGADFIEQEIGFDPEKAIMISNFVGDALDIAKELGFRGALLIGHIGKLVKIAGGMFNTHSQYGDCRMEIIAAHAGSAGLSAPIIEEILTCATCDDALRMLKENSLDKETMTRITERIAFNMNYRVSGEMETGAILFSKPYGFLSATDGAASLLKRIKEE